MSFQFIGPNAEELTFQSLFPDFPREFLSVPGQVASTSGGGGGGGDGGGGRGGGGGGAGAETAMEGAGAPGLEVANLDVQFMGPNAAELTFRALHPDGAPPAWAGAEAAAAGGAGGAAAAAGAEPGRPVQVDPMKPVLAPPGTNRLTLECDTLLSSFAFNSNLRRFNRGWRRSAAAGSEGWRRQAAAGRRSP